MAYVIPLIFALMTFLPSVASATPLHDGASERRKIAEVKRLIAAGADVNAKLADDGRTLLHEASADGHAEVVKVLLDAGADVNAKLADDESTPLHVASWQGSAEVVKILLAAGADVNAKNKYGQTPLSVASYFGRAEVVKILKAAGGKK